MINIHFVFILTLFVIVKGQCPTKGMTSFVIVSITPNVTEDDFKHLIDYYGSMTEDCGSKYTHEIHFGSQKRRTITSKDFKTLWDTTDATSLYISSIVDSTDVKQNDVDKLTDVMKDILISVWIFKNFIVINCSLLDRRS